jgi:hypothetical protein
VITLTGIDLKTNSMSEDGSVYFGDTQVPVLDFDDTTVTVIVPFLPQGGTNLIFRTFARESNPLAFTILAEPAATMTQAQLADAVGKGLGGFVDATRAHVTGLEATGLLTAQEVVLLNADLDVAAQIVSELNSDIASLSAEDARRVENLLRSSGALTLLASSTTASPLTATGTVAPALSTQPFYLGHQFLYKLDVTSFVIANISAILKAGTWISTATGVGAPVAGVLATMNVAAGWVKRLIDGLLPTDLIPGTLTIVPPFTGWESGLAPGDIATLEFQAQFQPQSSVSGILVSQIVEGTLPQDSPFLAPIKGTPIYDAVEAFVLNLLNRAGLQSGLSWVDSSLSAVRKNSATISLDMSVYNLDILTLVQFALPMFSATDVRTLLNKVNANLGILTFSDAVVSSDTGVATFSVATHTLTTVTTGSADLQSKVYYFDSSPGSWWNILGIHLPVTSQHTETLVVSSSGGSLTPPSAATGLSASSPSSTLINLTWTDSSNNENGFKIERKLGVAGTYAEIATAGKNAESYADSSLTPGTAYYYRVRAFNGLGNAPYSNEANTTTATPPLDPSGMNATAASSTRVDLTWTDNSGNETGFKIRRKTGAGSFILIGQLSANATSYQDNTTAASTTYTYSVASYNASGESGPSVDAVTTPAGGGGGGGGWTTAATGTTRNLQGVWGPASSSVFAVGNNGTILRYNGAAWSPMTSGSSSFLGGVWGSSSSNVFTAGTNGEILRYNGATWSPMTSGFGGTYFAVWGTAANNVFAVGSSAKVSRYNGSVWSDFSPPSGNTWYGVWATGSHVFVVGAGGTIRRHDGSTWQTLASGTTVDLQAVSGTSITNVFAVGSSGRILRFNGTTWSNQTSGTTDHLYGVWANSGTDVFAAGRNGRILHYNGTSWSPQTSGTGVTLHAVAGFSSSSVFVVGDSGKSLLGP